MFEYSRFWISARRSIALSGLVLLLTFALSGFVSAPAAAQVVDGGITAPGAETGVTATDEDIDEWEDDILNTPSPQTEGGIVEQVVSFVLRSLGLAGGGSGSSAHSLR